MKTPAEYMCLTSDRAKRARIFQQWKDAGEKTTIICCCGQLRHLTVTFRCLYCGEWYCYNCAQIHFGKPSDEKTP